MTEPAPNAYQELLAWSERHGVVMTVTDIGKPAGGPVVTVSVGGKVLREPEPGTLHVQLELPSSAR
jgi:hypothetical protein